MRISPAGPLGVIGDSNAGNYDPFLSKFDTLGNEVWTTQIGTSSDDNSHAVAVDASGNVYISGRTYGIMGDSSAGGYDAYLTKFDSSGDEVWSSQIGSSSQTGMESWDDSYSVAVDGSGNAYISGWTFGVVGDSSAGGIDAFLVKFDSLGNELWTQQIGTEGTDYCYSVAVDGSGNAFISGYTNGDLAGPSAGGQDAFLVKYDSLGNELWTQQTGTSGDEYSYSVAVDALGNAYITGQTNGVLGDSSAGGWDAFLVKYEVPEPATLSILAIGSLGLMRRRRK